jgi:hypothetical protein
MLHFELHTIHYFSLNSSSTSNLFSLAALLAAVLVPACCISSINDALMPVVTLDQSNSYSTYEQLFTTQSLIM